MSMKKIAVILVVMVGILNAAEATLVTASEDATIQSDAADANYGSAADLWARNETSMRMAYMQFDTSALGTVTNINSVQAYGYNINYDRGVSVYLVTNSAYMAWSEDTITWNNAPGNNTATQYLLNDAGFIVGTFDAPSANGTLAMNWLDSGSKGELMDMVNSQDAVTLVFVRPTDRWSKFASTEAIDGSHPVRMDVNVIPEPATLGLVAVTFCALGLLRRLNMG